MQWMGSSTFVKNTLLVVVLQSTSLRCIGQHDDIFPKGTAEKDHRLEQNEEQFIPKSHRSLRTLEATEPGFNLTEEELVKFKIWPNGVIPFYIDDFSFDNAFSNKLRRTLQSTNSLTGLRFIEIHKTPTKEDERRWVFFINRRGALDCEDYTTNSFSNNGVQHVVVGYDCLGGKNSLAATLLALLGVPPQHNAPNRDEYISIIYENIIPEKHILFERLKNDQWLFHDVDYDFHSAGHYDRHKFTVNGSATIAYKVNGEDEDRDCLSFKDILKIKMLYNYIVRKSQSSLNKGQCSKVFKPGHKTENVLNEYEVVVQPRKKPEKYLYPDETPYPDSIDGMSSTGLAKTEHMIEKLHNNNIKLCGLQKCTDLEDDENEHTTKKIKQTTTQLNKERLKWENISDSHPDYEY